MRQLWAVFVGESAGLGIAWLTEDQELAENVANGLTEASAKAEKPLHVWVSHAPYHQLLEPGAVEVSYYSGGWDHRFAVRLDRWRPPKTPVHVA